MPFHQRDHLLRRAMQVALTVGVIGLGSCMASEDKSSLTSRSVLGSDLAYIKQEFGDPVLNRDGQPTYQVGGCDIQFETEGTKITSYSSEIVESCNLEIDEIEVNSDTAIGSILGQMGAVYIGVSCIDCGNAADPEFVIIQPGARFNNFVTLSFSSDYQSASELIRQWSDVVRQIETNQERQGDMKCADFVGAEILSYVRALKLNYVRVSNDEPIYDFRASSSFCQY